MLNSRGKEESVHLSCTGISHHGTLHRVTVAESGRNHQSGIGDASVQDAFADEMDEGSRVDPPLIFGGGAPPSEWPCRATQNCVATQFRFGHSCSCTLQIGFRTVPVKFRPRRATLTRRGTGPSCLLVEAESASEHACRLRSSCNSFLSVRSVHWPSEHVSPVPSRSPMFIDIETCH